MVKLLVAVLLLAMFPAATGAGARGEPPPPPATCPARPALAQSVSNQDFRVWFGPGDRGEAALLLNTVQAIAGKLSFMPKPFPDTISCSSGGSAHTDFYVVDSVRPSFWDPRNDRASVFVLPPAGDPAGGFIEVAKGGSSVARGCAVAHAYFHLVQARYGFQNLRANFWWYEGTADLAEYLHFKHCDLPGQDADLYLDRLSHRSFEALNGYPEAYGTWLWPLYLYNHAGPNSILRVFQRLSNGSSAVDAIPTSAWNSNFPDFALGLWNKGPVDELKRKSVTRASVSVREVDLNVGNGAVKRASFRLLLHPTASRHLLLDLLDVNTRYVSLDFSDFAGKRPIHIKALQQWTKGPDPAATANDWDGAAISDWTGKDKIYLCRDEESDDFQQILVAISNVDPDSDTIRARVKIRAEAFCPWNATGRLTITGAPGHNIIGVPETGRYSRKTTWELKPDGPPVVCPLVVRACLPLVGIMRDAVEWNTQSSWQNHHETVVMGAAGTQTYTYASRPRANDLARPALFQEMVWDAGEQKFRPVISIMFSNARLRPDETYVHQTRAQTAHWEYDLGGCYLANNVQGLVNWKLLQTSVCTDPPDSGQYGRPGPLYFAPFEPDTDLKPAAENKPGDGFCEEPELIYPWDVTSSGPCVSAKFDPHAIAGDVRITRFRDTSNRQPEGAFSIHRTRQGECEVGTAEPCPVATENFPFNLTNSWPLSIRVSLVLRRAPDPDR